MLFALQANLQAQQQDVIVYTEDYPPYNVEEADGAVGGLATAKVRQLLDASGLKYDIRLVPWTRAVLYASMRDNALVFSMTRTPTRETDFEWLALLAEADFQVFVRMDEMRPVTLDTIGAGHFTAACASRDLACDLFRQIGLPEQNLIVIGDSSTGDFRMVLAGRADLYISQALVNDWRRKKDGFDPRSTKPVLSVEGEGGLYLAAGTKLRPEFKDAIKRAHERLVADEGFAPLPAMLQLD